MPPGFSQDLLTLLGRKEGKTLQSVDKFNSTRFMLHGENRVEFHCMEVGYHTAMDSSARDGLTEDAAVKVSWRELGEEEKYEC